MIKKTKKLDREAESLYRYLIRKATGTPEAIYSGWVRESGIVPEPENIPALMRVISRYQEISATPELLRICGQALSERR